MKHGRRAKRVLAAEHGATNAVMLVTLVVVLAAAGVTAWLLIRTADAANDVADKADRIAMNGRGINIATDSVIQLRRTNEIANDILRSARPLDGQLTQVLHEARSIDATAGAIDATAGAIDSTAGEVNHSTQNIDRTASAINTAAHDIDTTAERIDTTAGTIDSVGGAIESTASRIDTVASGIAGEAVQILDVAEAIDHDVRLINTNLDDSIRIASAIEADTGSILAQALAAHQTAACIDRRLIGSDGHCENAPNAQRRVGRAPSPQQPRETPRGR